MVANNSDWISAASIFKITTLRFLRRTWLRKWLWRQYLDTSFAKYDAVIQSFSYRPLDLFLSAQQPSPMKCLTMVTMQSKFTL